MRSATTPPLAAGSVDLTPGVIALAPRPGRGTVTRTCTSCGERRANGQLGLATRVPPWFHISGAVFFGVAYYGAVSRLWTQGPLGAANRVYDDSPLHHLLLKAAPVWIPIAFLALLGVLGGILFRARDVSLSVCEPCMRTARAFRALFVISGPVLVAIVVVALHQAAGFALPVLAVGVVLLPFGFARAILRRVTPRLEGGLALGRCGDGVFLCAVPAAAETVLRKEAPDELRAETPLDRRYHLGWALPLVLAVFVHLALVSAVRTQACPYGAVPMTWTERGERHSGCMTPAGARHGHWQGRAGGEPSWEADYRFDRVVPGTKIWFDERGQPREGPTRGPNGVPLP